MTLLRLAFLSVAFLPACSGEETDADADADVDADTDGDTDTDTGTEPVDCFDCEIEWGDQRTPAEIFAEPTCESGDYERTIEDLVTDAQGRAISWTELRIYHPPEKEVRHEVRADYTIESFCPDDTISEYVVEMHSLRPMFRTSCDGTRFCM